MFIKENNFIKLVYDEVGLYMRLVGVEYEVYINIGMVLEFLIKE